MIESIHVRNFRSLRDLRLDLGKRNVLVGPNMAGKSNILDFFKFVSQMLVPGSGVSGIVSTLNRRNGFMEVAWKGDTTETISFSISGNLPKQILGRSFSRWTYHLSVLGNLRGWITIQEERLTVSGDGETSELIVKKDGQRILQNNDGREITRVQDDRPAMEFEIPDWHGNVIRLYLQLFRFYKLIPTLMRQYNPASAAPFLNEVGDNLGAWLMTLQTRHLHSFSKIRDAAKDALPEVAELFTSPTQQATIAVGTMERHLRRPIGVWEMSDGELTFIALLSLLFAPNELGGTLYCIEEPENHLHPKLIEALIRLHNQVQLQLGAEAGQVILTTHSPQLVDLCGLEDLIVVERRNGETVCTRPRDKDHLRNLLAREEVGLGELFFSGALTSAD